MPWNTQKCGPGQQSSRSLGHNADSWLVEGHNLSTNTGDDTPNATLDTPFLGKNESLDVRNLEGAVSKNTFKMDCDQATGHLESLDPVNGHAH